MLIEITNCEINISIKFVTALCAVLNMLWCPWLQLYQGCGKVFYVVGAVGGGGGGGG